AGSSLLHQGHARRFSAIRFESSSHPGPMVANKHRVHILRHPVSHFLRRKVEEYAPGSRRREEANTTWRCNALKIQPREQPDVAPPVAPLLRLCCGSDLNFVSYLPSCCGCCGSRGGMVIP